MKLAKKLLACLMVLAIAVSCAAMAFAASGTPSIKLSYDTDDDALYLNFVDAVGLKSWDLTITYETKAFDGVDSSDSGEDSVKVGNTKSNTINVGDGINSDTAGTILFGGYFKESLWTAEEFLADAKKGKDASVNATDFEAVMFYMLTNEAFDFSADYTTISVAGSFSMSDDSKVSVSDSIVVGTKQEETTTAAPEITTAAPEITTAAPEITTAAPEITTAAPEITTAAPEVTTKEADETTTAGPIVRPTTEEDESNIVVRPTDKDGRKIDDSKDTSELPAPTHDKHIKTGDSAVLAAAAGVILLAGAAFVVSKKRK